MNSSWSNPVNRTLAEPMDLRTSASRARRSPEEPVVACNQRRTASTDNSATRHAGSPRPAGDKSALHSIRRVRNLSVNSGENRQFDEFAKENTRRLIVLGTADASLRRRGKNASSDFTRSRVKAARREIL